MIEEEVLEEEDLRAVRINYLDKFVQVTKTWVKILSGAGSVSELEAIRKSMVRVRKKEKREEEKRKKKEKKKTKKKVKAKKKSRKKTKKKSK